MDNKTEYKSYDYFDVESYENEYDTDQINFSPSLGWFVANGLAIGVTFNYEYSKEHNKEEQYKQKTYLYGPSLSYFFGKSNIKPYIQAEYLFGKTKNEYEFKYMNGFQMEYENDENEIKIQGWGLGAGVAFFLNQHISLNLGLGYAKINGESSDDDYFEINSTSKGFILNGGVSAFF
jgi:opacity protein-like surface antigen